jgi:hypothetical protein
MKKVSSKILVIGATVATLVSCQKERSPVTAWEYNNPKNGGFEVVPYEEQETGPGLVLVQGGTFTMEELNKMLLTIGILFQDV